MCTDHHTLFFVAEVSVSFEKGSSVTYAFQDSFLVMRDSSSQASSSVSTESRENVAFSFITTQAPAMLLTISTFSYQYMAIILARNGKRHPMIYTTATS